MDFEVFETFAQTAAETRTLAGTAAGDLLARFLARTDTAAETEHARATAHLARLIGSTPSHGPPRTDTADHQSAAGPPDHPATVGPVVPRGPSAGGLLAVA